MDGSTRKKCERIIVFRNVFDPKEFDVSCCDEFAVYLIHAMLFEKYGDHILYNYKSN